MPIVILKYHYREYERNRQGLRQALDEAQRELEQVSSNLGQQLNNRVSSRRQQDALTRNINHLEGRIQDVNESLRVGSL